MATHITAPTLELPRLASMWEDVWVEVYASNGIHTTWLDLGRAHKYECPAEDRPTREPSRSGSLKQAFTDLAARAFNVFL